MARSVDQQRRSELLAKIVDYVTVHGLANLSLRPLAEGVGSSPRGLLYYFTSKEELVVEVLAAARARQRGLFATLPRNPRTYADTIRAAWALMSAPHNEPAFRLFFEVYGLALQDRERFAAFLHGAVDDWLDYLQAGALRNGYTADDARAFATMLLGGYRGFLLDLCATRDRDRIARAVELWILALDALPSPKELRDGHANA